MGLSDSREEDDVVREFIARYGQVYAQTHNRGMLEALDGAQLDGSRFSDVVCQLIKSTALRPEAEEYWTERRMRIRQLRYCAEEVGVELVERLASRCRE
ncbi:MAG: hypothetical protein U0228_02410 [Myxococcaceae bacterium]